MMNKVMNIDKDKLCGLNAQIGDGIEPAMVLDFKDYANVEKDVALVVDKCAFIRSDDITVAFRENERNVLVIPIRDRVQVRLRDLPEAFYNIVNEFKELNKGYTQGEDRAWGKPELDKAKAISTKRN